MVLHEIEWNLLKSWDCLKHRNGGIIKLRNFPASPLPDGNHGYVPTKKDVEKVKPMLVSASFWGLITTFLCLMLISPWWIDWFLWRFVEQMPKSALMLKGLCVRVNLHVQKNPDSQLEPWLCDSSCFKGAGWIQQLWVHKVHQTVDTLW